MASVIGPDGQQYMLLPVTPVVVERSEGDSKGKAAGGCACCILILGAALIANGVHNGDKGQLIAGAVILSGSCCLAIVAIFARSVLNQ